MARGLLLLGLALIMVSQTSSANTAEEHDALFRAGSEMLRPYIFLGDRQNADPKSAEGRRKIAEGIRNLTRVTQMNPGNWPAFWMVGKGYQAVGDHASAYAALREAFRINPGQPDVAREFMLEAICIGQTDEAVSVAERAVQLRPQDAGLMANLGFAFLAKGELERARVATAKALEAAPQDRITQTLASEISAVAEGRRQFSVARYCGQ